MKAQIKVTVNDEDVLKGLEEFLALLKKRHPGTITWGEMSTTKKLDQSMSSIARAIAAHKKSKEIP
jgi:hypothetical protein